MSDISKATPDDLADDLDEDECPEWDPFITVLVAEALVFGIIMIGIAATIQDWPLFCGAGGVH